MITIYGAYKSRATRAFWLLNELGMEVRHVPVIQKNRLFPRHEHFRLLESSIPGNPARSDASVASHIR